MSGAGANVPNCCFGSNKINCDLHCRCNRWLNFNINLNISRLPPWWMNFNQGQHSWKCVRLGCCRLVAEEMVLFDSSNSIKLCSLSSQSFYFSLVTKYKFQILEGCKWNSSPSKCQCHRFGIFLLPDACNCNSGFETWRKTSMNALNLDCSHSIMGVRGILDFLQISLWVGH